jgi:RHS repeat-associated protein
MSRPPAALRSYFGKVLRSSVTARPRQIARPKRHVTRSSSGVTSLPARVVSVLLAMAMLANSTPAAPRVLSVAAAGWSLNLGLWYASSGWKSAVGGLLQGQGAPAARAQESQGERDDRVAVVRIYPGDVTLSVGERVNFAAVAFDQGGEPVGGVRFRWGAQEAGRGRRARVSRQGEFEARAAGTYLITAAGARKEARVTVRVLEGRLPPRRPDASAPGGRQVSSRDLPAQTAAQQLRERGVRKSRTAKPSTSLGSLASRTAHAALPPRQGDMAVWDDNNYWSADDPYNRRGDTPGAALDGGAGSGNFQLAAPVLSLPGRGLDLSLALAYNSRVWNKAVGGAANEITFDIDHDWPAPGWSLGFGKIVRVGSNGVSMMIDADGTRRAFTGTIQGGYWFYGSTADGTFTDYWTFTDGYGNITSGEARFANGTVIQYGARGQNAIYPTRITDRNGNYVIITYRNSAGPQIETVTDTLGRTVFFHYDWNNLLTAVTGPGVNGGSRTLVRLHYFQKTLDYYFTLPARVRSQTVWLVDAVYYPGTSTGYWFGDGDSYSSYGMIRKVSERRGMALSAGSLNEQGAVSAGVETRRVLYDYPVTPGGALSDAPTYQSSTETWAGMDTGDAVTVYSVDQNASPRRTEITLPNGTKSVQLSYNAPGQYYDGLIYQDETRDAAGALLQSSTTSWEQGAYSSPRPTRTEAVDHEIGKKLVTTFGYGPYYNQVTAVRNYDYCGVGENPSALLNLTTTEYENGDHYRLNRHIFNLVKKVEVYADELVTKVSRTDYQYDGAALADTPNVTHHDEAYNPYATTTTECGWEDDQSDPDYLNPGCAQWDPSCDGQVNQIYVCREVNPFNSYTNYRGIVTQLTRYANAAAGGGAITETRRYDRTGNLITASSSCCEQTSVTYTLGTQYAYPSAQTRGAATTSGPQVTTSATYDFNTGLLKTSTDANGRTAQSFYYPQTLRPQAVYAPTNARTEYAYDDAQMTVTETTYAADNTLAAQTVRRLNGNGQVRREEARGEGANVWDVVETKYDALGRVKEQSRPFRDGAETPRWNKTFYDALGRVYRAEAPDGSATESFYNEASYPPAATQGQPGQTVRVRDAWGRERWGRTDARGRLVEVVEPNPYGGGAVSEAGGLLTRYSYNTLGDLIEATQGAQARRFRYDSLGRLTHQKLAEATATITDAGTFVGVGGGGAQWSDYFTYDERSNLVTRLDARGVLTEFIYRDANNQPDPLNRLQSVRYTPPAGSGIAAAATVSYVYETDAAKDRTRVRQIATSGVSTEALDYDSEGRIHQRTLTLDSRSSYPFATNYVYDSLDRLTDVTYPAQYGVSGNPRKVVHHDFDAASRLSGLKVNNVSHASEIGYNASSQTTSLKVGAAGANQMTETYAYDPLTGLLAGQKVFRGTDAVENRLLDLSYDYLREGTTAGRTGHLTKVTDNRDAAKNRHYEYDPLGRLRRASAGGAAGSWAQRYLYDRYGNRSYVLSLKTSDWVTTLYNVTLNRAPDSGGLAAWDNVLRNGYAQGQAAFLQSAKDTAAGFFDSTEYLNRNRTNSEYVRDLYLAYLNREPDQAGWDAWTNLLNNGASRQSVRAGFADSGEFANRVSGMYPTASTAAAAAPRDGHAYLSFDAQTNRVNSPGWEYDASGNQTRALLPDGVTWRRFEYDAANRLVRVKADDNQTVLSTYIYGDSNQRLMTAEGSTLTYYAAEGGQVLAEYTEYTWWPGNLSWAKSYIYLGGRLLTTFAPGGWGSEAVEHHHPDRLGTRVVTRPSDGSSFEQAHLPFGNGAPSESPSSTNRRFTSYDRSGGTGLDYAVNRRYDPMQGRFTQVDPIEMEAVDLSDPQTLNLYSYCANDPVNYTDPDGLFIGRLFKWISKALRILTVVAAVAAALVFLGPSIPFVTKAAMWFLFDVLIPLSQIPVLGPAIGGAVAGSWTTPGWNPNAKGLRLSFQDPVGANIGGCGDINNPCDLGVVNSARTPWYKKVWRATNSVIDFVYNGNQAVADQLSFGHSPGPAGHLFGLLGRTRPNTNSAGYRIGTTVGQAESVIVPGPRLLKLPGLNTSRFNHIFRNAPGHVNPTTLSSQNRYLNLFQRVADDPANLQSVSAYGVSTFTKVYRNGRQVWVQVRNGRIANAGVNP